MENRVSDTEGLAIKVLEHDLPATLSHESKYQGEQYCSGDNDPPGQPPHLTHCRQGPKTHVTFGCKADSQQEITQEESAEDDSRQEKDENLCPQDGGKNTAIAEAIKPEPLTIEPLAYVQDNKEYQEGGQDYYQPEGPAALGTFPWFPLSIPRGCALPQSLK